MDAFVTSVSWFASSGKQASEVFAAACSDGSVRLITRAGREEKKASVMARRLPLWGGIRLLGDDSGVDILDQSCSVRGPMSGFWDHGGKVSVLHFSSRTPAVSFLIPEEDKTWSIHCS